MTNHKYSVLVENGKATSVTWHGAEGETFTATDSHPKFAQIRGALTRGESHESVMALFSPRQRVNEYFSKVGLFGVHFNGSVVLVDGKPVPTELSQMIIDHVDSDTDPTGLVLFFKNLNSNPSYQSKQELVSFIDRHGLTITDDGHFIAYKGLRTDNKSVHSGLAYVDGKAYNGRIPNEKGSTITLPRGDVDDNRDIGCSTGLHAGTWSYASGFGSSGHTAMVKINPADVVSVPKDHNEQKLRVCRYTVVELNTPKKLSTLIWQPETSTNADVLWKDGEGERTATTGNTSSSVLWSA